MFLRTILLICLTAACASALQTDEAGPKPAIGLRVLALETSATPRATQLRSSAVLGSVRCDREGTLYFRQYLGTDSDARNPVIALGNDGRKQAEFRLEAVPGLARDSTLFTFNVSGGRLFALVGERGESEMRLWLAEFDRQGAFVSKSLFAKPFFPTVFASLPPDRFYVAGLDKPLGPSSKGKERPTAGIFDSEARLVRDLSTKSQEGKIEEIIGTHLGDASWGPDGNLYFLKASAKPVLSIVTPNGDVQRKLNLRPPLPGAQAYELHVREGSLIVGYQWSKPQRFAEGVEGRTVYAVYNLYDGEPVVHYANRMRGIPACFTEDSVTFLTATLTGFFGLLSIPLR